MLPVIKLGMKKSPHFSTWLVAGLFLFIGLFDITAGLNYGEKGDVYSGAGVLAMAASYLLEKTRAMSSAPFFRFAAEHRLSLVCAVAGTILILAGMAAKRGFF